MNAVEALVTPLGWLLRTRRADPRLSVRQASELRAPGRLEVSSPAFEPGGTIPPRHCSGGGRDNLSPALHWSRLPDGSRQLLLIVEDIDSPFRRPSVHTVALLEPTEAGLQEGALIPDDPRFRYLPNHRGRTGYVGPQPLPGHGTHRYGFHLYALDKHVDPDGIDLDQLLPHLAGHVLAAGLIEGVQVR